MSEALLYEPPRTIRSHDAPPELERVFAMRRDELEPEARFYADNLHAQILAIFAEHGAKNFADFERIAREQALPLSLLERIQSLMHELLQTIETGEVPEHEHSIIIHDAPNPYHEALTVGGLTDHKKNPERIDRIIDLQKFIDESTKLYQEHRLSAWETSVRSADFSHLTPEQRQHIDALLKDGWEIIAVMPGKKEQLKNLKEAMTTVQPLCMKDSLHQPRNHTYIWKHMLDLIDQKAAELTHDVPDRPYLLLTPSTQNPSKRTTKKTLDEQQKAFAQHRQISPTLIVHVMNPAEYTITQVRYTRNLQKVAQAAGHTLTVLDPLDKFSHTRFINLPISQGGLVPGAYWDASTRQLKFGGDDHARPDAKGGFRLVVRMEL